MAEIPFSSPHDDRLTPPPSHTPLDFSNSGDSPDSFSTCHDSTNTPAPEGLPLYLDQGITSNSIDNSSYFSCIPDIQPKLGAGSLDVSAHSTDLDISTQSSDLNLSNQSDPIDETSQREEDRSFRVSTSTPVKFQDKTLTTDPSSDFGNFADADDSSMLDSSPDFGALSVPLKSGDEGDHTDMIVSSGTDPTESSDHPLWTTAPQNLSNKSDEELIGAQSSVAMLSSESSGVSVLTDHNQSTHTMSITETKSDNIDPTKSSSSSILVLGRSHIDCQRSQSLEYSDGDATVEGGEDVFEKKNVDVSNIESLENLKIHQVQSGKSITSLDIITPDQEISTDKNEPKSDMNRDIITPDITPGEEISTDKNEPKFDMNTDIITPGQEISTDKNEPKFDMNTEESNAMSDMSTDIITPDQDISTDKNEPKSDMNTEESNANLTQNNSPPKSTNVKNEVSPQSSDGTGMSISLNTVIFNIDSVHSDDIDKLTVADIDKNQPGGFVPSCDAISPEGTVDVTSSSIEVLTSPSADLRNEDSLDISEPVSEVSVIDDLPNSTEVGTLEPTNVPAEESNYKGVNEDVIPTNIDHDQTKAVSEVTHKQFASDNIVQKAKLSSSGIKSEEIVNDPSFRDESTENFIKSTEDIDEIDDEIMELSHSIAKSKTITPMLPNVKIDDNEIESLKTITPEEYISSQESSPVNRRANFEESSESATVESGHTTPSTRIRTPSLQSVNSQPNHYSHRNTEYPATDSLIFRVQNLLRQEDVNIITTKQKTMLNKLECTNQKLMSFNEVSEIELEKAQLNFRHYTRLLIDMRKDVEIAFKRIGSIKSKLSIQYPEAWRAMSVYTCTDYIDPDEEDHSISKFINRLPVVRKDSDQASHDSFVVVGSYSSSTRDERLGSLDEDTTEASKRELDERTLEATVQDSTDTIKIADDTPQVDTDGGEEGAVLHYELSNNSIREVQK